MVKLRSVGCGEHSWIAQVKCPRREQGKAKTHERIQEGEREKSCQLMDNWKEYRRFRFREEEKILGEKQKRICQRVRLQRRCLCSRMGRHVNGECIDANHVHSSSVSRSDHLSGSYAEGGGATHACLEEAQTSPPPLPCAFPPHRQRQDQLF